jgi:hypothetical protein
VAGTIRHLQPHEIVPVLPSGTPEKLRLGVEFDATDSSSNGKSHDPIRLAPTTAFFLKGKGLYS